jgi:DNA-binding transcriptional regulator GbsR (MarR family)
LITSVITLDYILLLSDGAARKSSFMNALDFNGFMKTPTNHLKELYSKRRERNPSYSLRAFARDAGVSQTLLSLMLSEKRSVTLKQGLRFYALYREEFSPKAEVFDVKDLDLNLEYEIILRQWHHLPILEMAPLKRYEGSSRLIAEDLGISRIEAEQAMKRLLRVGLLKKTKTGFTKVHRHTFFEVKKPTDSVRSFHRAMLSRASEAMNLSTAEDYAARDITGHTLVTHPERIEAAKTKIRKFQRSLIKFLTQDTTRDEISSHSEEVLFQLGIQLFPLTSLRIKKNKETKK